jgi:ATP-dependent RNA helicase RhlE
MKTLKQQTMPFSSLGLSAALRQTLADLKFERPYPIQEQAIPAVLLGKDLFGIAPTGSGKTASYVLPLLTKLGKEPQERNRNIRALIVVPTRELAMQVQQVIYSFSNRLPEKVSSMAVYGGVSINPQMKALMGTSILVATPGRLLELIDNNALQLGKCDTLVLDEADKLLNLGFHDEMQRIIGLLPKKRQNLLFSATLTDDVSAITQLLLNDPVVIKIVQEEETVDLIEQTAFRVSEERKGPLLRHLIKSRDMQQVLVFTSSVFKADTVTAKLQKNGINAVAIHSKKSQEARRKALDNFKAGRTRVLVATDLISRGIDIHVLPFVINYELPRSPKEYVHRIGRTGRADATGEAFAFVTPEDEHHFKIIQKKMGKQVPYTETEGMDLT